jgi:TPR repeat protein
MRPINPISNRSLQPAFRCAISQAAKRAIVIVACCFAVLINLRTAVADSASDREMASRYEQAAQAGDDDAQFYLGALYSAGVGRSRSDQEAFRWFSRATDQGHAHAMLIVAGLYASGRGTTKDNVKAYSLAYIVASASKLDEDRNGARQLMSLLMKKMTSDEIGHAVVAARAWRAVRTAGAAKASNIERTVEQDQAAPAAPPPAPAVVQPAPAAAPAVSQPAPSSVTALPASPRAASAAPVKNAKRDDARELLDQVPSGLRKRFGF